MSKDKVVKLGLLEKESIGTEVLKKEKVSGFELAKGKKLFERNGTEHAKLW